MKFKFSERAIERVLEAIEIRKQRIVALEYATSGLRSSSINDFTGPRAILFSALHRDLNEAYQDLFMWATVYPEKALKKAQKAAFGKFLRQNVEIMSYLQYDLKRPGAYLGVEEETFRKEIAALKKEAAKKVGDEGKGER